MPSFASHSLASPAEYGPSLVHRCILIFGGVVEVPLLAAGMTLRVIGKNLSITRKFVPPGGLDPSDVRWSFDRGSSASAS
jgi:hypothetical protein